MLGIPKFKTYEDLLGSSWLSLRVSTILCLILAFQSKKVIEAFSLYSGWVRDIHSFGITILIALAILTFTVKIHNVPVVKYGTNWLKVQLTLLVLFFAGVEFMLQVAYHILWENGKRGVIDFTIPDFTAEMGLMLFIDAMLPAALFFYAHTVHIKTKSELAGVEEGNTSSAPSERGIDIGDNIIVQAPTGRKTSLKIISNEKEKNDDDENVIGPST